MPFWLLYWVAPIIDALLSDRWAPLLILTVTLTGALFILQLSLVWDLSCYYSRSQWSYTLTHILLVLLFSA